MLPVYSLIYYSKHPVVNVLQLSSTDKRNMSIRVGGVFLCLFFSFIENDTLPNNYVHSEIKK